MTLPKAGEHVARATKAEFGQSENKGTDYIRVFFEILEGDNAGMRVSDRFYLADTTAGRIIEGLRYCGCTFPKDDITDLTGLQKNAVQIVIEHERKERGTFYQIRWINSLEGRSSSKQAMSPADKQRFKDRMRGHLLKAKAEAQQGQGYGGHQAPPQGHGYGGYPASQAQKGQGYGYPSPPQVDDTDMPF